MKRVAGIALALALGACSWLGVKAPSPEAAAASRSDDLLDYLAELRAMNATRLTAEAARERKAAPPGATGDVARLKAALALTLAASPDDGDILALLEPILRRPATDPKVAGMANFLHATVVERRRLRESATAAGARQREDHRALEQQRQRAEALQDRAAELQKKLDALSDLEKSLTDRQSPSH